MADATAGHVDSALQIPTAVDHVDNGTERQPPLGTEIQLALNLIPAHAWYALPSGALTFLNRRGSDYLGLPTDHPLRSGMDTGAEWDSHLSFLHPDDREETRRVWSTCLRTGIAGQVTFRVRDASGGYRWFLSQVEPVRGSDGTLLHWIGVDIDIEGRKQARRQAEFYLAEGQRLAHMGSWAFNAAGFDYWSPELLRIHGLDPGGQAPTIEEYMRLVHPDDRGFVAETIQKMFAEGRGFDFTKRIVLPDGEIRLVRCVGVLATHGGTVQQFVGSGIDVTEQEQLTKALRQSEYYLAEGQRLAHMGSWVFDPAGFFSHWSRELFRIYGCDADDVAPSLEEYLALIHPQDREFMRLLITRMVAGASGCDVIKRIVRPDREVRYVRCVGIPIVENGALQRIVGTAMDVTEHELLTQELRRREAYLADAQRLTHTGSGVWNVADRSAEHVSEEWYRVYGFNPAERPPAWEQRLERVHPEDRLKWKGTFERAIQDKADFEVDYRILLPDGMVKWIHAVGHPVLNEAGELVQFLGSSTDMTERKTAEEALNRARSELAHVERVTTLNTLTASIAHEINQPIAAAITSAGACLRWLNRDQPEVQRAREAVMRIEEDGKRAAEIITHLKSFYKKDVSPSRERVPVNDVAGEMLVLLRSEAQRHAVAMRTELAADLPLVSADRVQLQQVLMNLILNGMEAMGERGGELRISTCREGREVMVSVSDTGVGIPADRMQDIFTAFFTTKAGGTGMGLAISRTIVESHGGRLWATVNPGPGATFHFTLPTGP